ncbi:hypothetical protein XENOCAPTIV_010939, partial [Xenoophorus captivus]
PDSWTPPVSKTGSKPPEFREGFEDKPPPIQVRDGFEDGPPLLPMPEGSVGGLPPTIAPGPSDYAPELTDFVAGLTDVLPKAPDSMPDSKFRCSSTRRGRPPDRGSSTLLSRPPNQPADPRCCRRPPRSLCPCPSQGLHRCRRLIRPLSSGSWTPLELCACSGRPPGHPPELCVSCFTWSHSINTHLFCHSVRKHFLDHAHV